MKNPIAICALASAALGNASSAWAAILSVTTLNDGGPGSLRQAITDALPRDTSTFSVHGTITLTSGALTISRNLVIEGSGPNHLKTSGNHASRSGTVTLSGITTSDDLADANSPVTTPPTFSMGGGGTDNFGRLTVAGSRFSHNQAVGGSNGVSPFLSGHGFGGAIASGAQDGLVSSRMWRGGGA